MTSPWTISLVERQQSDIQFLALGPIGGMVEGEQARVLFVKSGLPAVALAQIWTLADFTRDGKLDQLEFSIAMKLIRNTLGGIPLPPMLPDSFKMAPVAPQMMPSAYPYTPVVNSVLPSTSASMIEQQQQRHLGDWSIAQSAKLRYCQQFNQLDKSRLGSLTGVHARNVMAESGLPTQILAQIWDLSSVSRRDGRLGVDDFCIAMHLIDKAKEGYILPRQTPPELLSIVPMAPRENTPPVVDQSMPPAQKMPSLKSFEDKRRDNYDRGQAELDRRRQILEEQERRRREDEERKEQEEMERREREREEMERRRASERAAEMQLERERAAARAEEERRLLADREAARLRLEAERQAELDRITLRQMEAGKVQLSEARLAAEQRQKTLTFQLQALDERSHEMNDQVTSLRDRIMALTSDIEQMKSHRDVKLADIADVQRQNREKTEQLERLSHEHLQMQSEGRDRLNRAEEQNAIQSATETARSEIAALHIRVEDIQVRTQSQREQGQKKRNELERVQTSLIALQDERKRLLTPLRQKQDDGRKLLRPIKVNEGMNGGTSDSPATAVSPRQLSGATRKYRAIYEFAARSEDELSFQPGDVVLVFEDHAAEPGWLAGQMRDKVGWFPQAFAEPIDATSSSNSATIASPVQVTPTERLERIVEEPVHDHPPKMPSSQSAQANSHVFNDKRFSGHQRRHSVVIFATAVYPWKAKNEGDLNFAKGDRIEIVEREELRWKGRLGNGQVGWFPKSYVKLEENGHGVAPISAAPLVNDNVNPGATNGEWYVAMYEFAAPEDTDLKFNVGDRIWVTETKDDWWKGTLDGREGIFPANYVQKWTEQSNGFVDVKSTARVETGRAVAAFEATASNQLSLAVGDMVHIRNKSDGGWWEGEIERPGQSPIAGWFPGNYIQLLGSTSVSSPPSLADVLFDYTAQRDDELTLKQGGTLEVLSKDDEHWWRGRRLSDGQLGLFPANFVNLRRSGHENKVNSMIPPPPNGHKPTSSQTGSLFTVQTGQTGDRKESNRLESAQQRKLRQQTEELFETEVKFHEDLKMVRSVFYKPLAQVLNSSQLETIFLNWNRLIDVSQQLHTALGKGSPGAVIVRMIDALQEFVVFCGGQQAALENLAEFEKNPAFQRRYTQCCEQARGLTLSYFLLLPMARVSRYPLLLEKMIKSSEDKHPDLEDLEAALQMTKALVGEVNQVLGAVDSMAMLCWCQRQINCDALQPQVLQFASPTRLLGARSYIHSAPLLKARSSRPLIGLLFNDFLMLTTLNEQLTADQLESVKLSKNSELKLTLYKTPILLEGLSIVPNATGDDLSLNLKTGTTMINLKAINRNMRSMWINQMESAIREYQSSTAPKAKKSNVQQQRPPIGRLLVELVSVRHLSRSFVPDGCLQCQMSSDLEDQTHSIDLNRTEALCISQFAIADSHSVFRLSLLLPRTFSPDLIAGQVEVSIHEIIVTSASHRGPILRQLSLTNSQFSNSAKAHIIIKFVVQMFDKV